MKTTKVYSALLAAYVNPAISVILSRGGTRSGKTWATLQLLDQIGRRSKRKRLISVVSETLPHLKRGAITDFKDMLEAEGAYNEMKWHDTDKRYSYKKGAIEFFSAAEPSKTMGPSREVLYMNEGINMDWKVYQQLSPRTTEKVIIDYNPAYDCWIDTYLIPRTVPHMRDGVLVPADVAIIDSTYLDNDELSARQIADIESNREIDPEWFKVYGLGLKGSKEGLVWKNWDIVRALPPRNEWKEAYIGIDFGWTAKTAVMLVVLSQGEVYIHELLYVEQGDNPQIAAAIIDAGYKDITAICDAAEPKSIAELKGLGIRAVKSDKKELDLGIRIANRYKKHYTETSLGTIAENRLYRYPMLPDGTYGTVPIKKNGHAKDAERYVFLNKLSNIGSGFAITSGRAGSR